MGWLAAGCRLSTSSISPGPEARWEGERGGGGGGEAQAALVSHRLERLLSWSPLGDSVSKHRPDSPAGGSGSRGCRLLPEPGRGACSGGSLHENFTTQKSSFPGLQCLPPNQGPVTAQGFCSPAVTCGLHLKFLTHSPINRCPPDPAVAPTRRDLLAARTRSACLESVPVASALCNPLSAQTN